MSIKGNSLYNELPPKISVFEGGVKNRKAWTENKVNYEDLKGHLIYWGYPIIRIICVEALNTFSKPKATLFSLFKKINIRPTFLLQEMSM